MIEYYEKKEIVVLKVLSDVGCWVSQQQSTVKNKKFEVSHHLGILAFCYVIIPSYRVQWKLSICLDK